MGTEYTYPNWEKYFTSVEHAKMIAEKDYGRPIKWSGRGKKKTSGDLLYVMYDIEEIKIEEEL